MRIGMHMHTGGAGGGFNGPGGIWVVLQVVLEVVLVVLELVL